MLTRRLWRRWRTRRDVCGTPRTSTRCRGRQRLALRLVEATFGDTVFFCNSGAEAMELAIKMARKYWSAKGEARHRMVTFEGSFHGRTLATISAAGNKKHTEGFGPLLDGFDIVPLSLEAARAAIGPATAAIIIEPVQGEGGIRPVPFELSARPAGARRRARAAAGLRRDPDGRRPHRHALRLRAGGRRARHHGGSPRASAAAFPWAP